jgi:cytochrome c553
MKLLKFKPLAMSLMVMAFCGLSHAAGDASAGEAKAQVCAACHGPGGASTQAMFPILAGQPAQSIASALYAYREGDRKNELMSPMAAKLTNKDLNDLAAYFSAQKAPPPTQSITPELASKARAVTVQYACVACHGAQLQGQQQMPRLAAQHRDYLRAQLLAFRSGQRLDSDGTMSSAAKSLADSDVDLLADYMASMQPQ